MKRITGAEFVEMWKDPGKYDIKSKIHKGCFVLLFEGYELVDDVVVEYDVQLEGLLLQSCTFKKSLSISCSNHVQLDLGGIFCQGTNLYSLEISNHIVYKLVLAEGSLVGRLSLQNCDMSSQFFVTTKSKV